jgi:Ser/Thr protein kinase RdoA (MazF antagonist)
MGNLVEVIEEEDGQAFLAIAYEKVEGANPKKEQMLPELFVEWGRLIGRMHKMTKSYVLRDPAWKRQEWYEEDQLNLNEYLDPEKDAEVFAAAEKLFARIHALPKDVDSYGLCHTDLHGGNIFVDENGNLKAFDFDDCQYSWFAAKKSSMANPAWSSISRRSRYKQQTKPALNQMESGFGL